MPATTKPGQDPAEGSRETIDHELQRTIGHERAEDLRRGLAPGDEAAPGTPGTGEDICPQCHGSGRIMAKRCPNCLGTGRIIKGIGGA